MSFQTIINVISFSNLDLKLASEDHIIKLKNKNEISLFLKRISTIYATLKTTEKTQLIKKISIIIKEKQENLNLKEIQKSFEGSLVNNLIDLLKKENFVSKYFLNENFTFLVFALGMYYYFSNFTIKIEYPKNTELIREKFYNISKLFQVQFLYIFKKYEPIIYNQIVNNVLLDDLKIFLINEATTFIEDYGWIDDSGNFNSIDDIDEAEVALSNAYEILMRIEELNSYFEISEDEDIKEFRQFVNAVHIPDRDKFYDEEYEDYTESKNMHKSEYWSIKNIFEDL